MKIRLTIAVVVLVAVVAALGATTWSQQPPFAVDHFLLYKTKVPKGTPKFAGAVATLADQFETRDVAVRKDRFLAVPTDKNGEGILDPDTHLVGYLTKDAKGQPKHLSRTVEVTNQFGAIRLQTKPAKLLLVPASKGLSGFLPPPDPAAHDVDHYRCYKVKPAKGAPKFQKILGVQVADQFQSKKVDVVKPTMLCNPAEKRRGNVIEAVKNPADHLLCYKVKAQSGEPKHVSTNVFLADQFGQLGRATVKEMELCVPSLKTVLDPPPPPTPTATYTPAYTPTPTDTSSMGTPTGPTPSPSATATATPPFCGDGMVNAPGEECDPPNPLDTDCDSVICTADCKIQIITATCGDGCLRPQDGEQCDPPGSMTCPQSGTCNASCRCPGFVADSFFDIFYRIDFTGCPAPGAPPQSASGPVRLKHGESNDPGDGREEVPTEIVEMTLTGGGVTLRELAGGSDPLDPLDPPCMGGPGCSGGLAKQQSAGSYSPSDLMQALQIELEQGPQTLVAQNAAPLQGAVNGYPIVNGDLMGGTCVPLADASNPSGPPVAFIAVDEVMISPPQP